MPMSTTTGQSEGCVAAPRSCRPPEARTRPPPPPAPTPSTPPPPRSFAFLEFATREDAEKAHEATKGGYKFDASHTLRVFWYETAR